MVFAEGNTFNWRLAVFLAAVTAIGCAMFGFAVGAFVDMKVAMLDAAKMAGVAVFSFVLCFPTLYVFAAISGARLSAARLAILGLVCTATLGCLLAALSPILWLFAVSTEKPAFMVFLSCIFAMLSFVFAARPIVSAARKRIVASTAGLNVWLAVFAVVSLQAVTLVRPMLAPIGSEREPSGKCFFLEHFIGAVR